MDTVQIRAQFEINRDTIRNQATEIRERTMILKRVLHESLRFGRVSEVTLQRIRRVLP